MKASQPKSGLNELQEVQKILYANITYMRQPISSRRTESLGLRILTKLSIRRTMPALPSLGWVIQCKHKLSARMCGPQIAQCACGPDTVVSSMGVSREGGSGGEWPLSFSPKNAKIAKNCRFYTFCKKREKMAENYAPPWKISWWRQWSRPINWLIQALHDAPYK